MVGQDGEAQDSAQRIMPPRSQQTASTTHDSLQLSTRSAMPLCVFSDVRPLAFHHALGSDVFEFLPRSLAMYFCCEARGAAPFWLSVRQASRNP
jgi:hypothetical protein